MDIYDYCIDNKYDLRLGYDRIGIGGGRVILIGDKAAPYGVVAQIIFVYEEGGGGNGLLCGSNMRVMGVFI